MTVFVGTANDVCESVPCEEMKYLFGVVTNFEVLRERVIRLEGINFIVRLGTIFVRLDILLFFYKDFYSQKEPETVSYNWALGFSVVNASFNVINNNPGNNKIAAMFICINKNIFYSVNDPETVS